MIDESFPDQYDDHKLVKDFCIAHPFYFVDILSLHQNSRFRYANFIFPYFWNMISALFPLRYPMNPETLILGGMLTNR